ncbi:MAG: VWA domain-containing protein [Odoribacter sp.]|nr:VWA domain-containing protein [Odoribacter sp.]
MTRDEIEGLYRRVVLERAWWGDFPEPLELLGKDFPETADIYRLMPVCARIALHVTGELPRVFFSREVNAPPNYEAVVMNPEILSLRVSEKIRSEVFFGQYIRQLGFLAYSRGVYEKYRCDFRQKHFIHLIETRRVEGRLVKAYPGYFYYLEAARRMVVTLSLLRAEQDLRFTDLDDVRYNYLAFRILYPELLEDALFRERLAPHRSRIGWIDELVDGIADFSVLEPPEVVELARRISARFLARAEDDLKMFNFYSKVMMNLPLEVEGAPVDIDVKILDDLFLDLTKSLELTPYDEDIEGDTKGALKRSGSPVEERYRETEAPCGMVDPQVLRRAKELAAKIRLNFLTFQAKMNKACVFYEQESGDLDEEELYQVHFNPHVFMEEMPAPSALLEVVVMLDLSGSMTDENKLELQLVLSVALALAFEANPDIRFSIYGHRVKQGRVEIVHFHEPGHRLEIKKLFSQEGMYVNADGFAIAYAMHKFRTRTQNKLLFMISDGTPTAAAGKQDPRVHVREMVREAQRLGVTVLSIGISNFNQSDMYDEFIPYAGPEVTVRLVQWLRRKFSHIADGATF